MTSLMARSLRAAGDLTGLEFLDDTALKKYGPEQMLSRMLSTKSYISTNSSQAAREQDAQDVGVSTARHVGEGQCGIVYALQGTDFVLKIPKQGKADELFEDVKMHKTIEEAFESLRFRVRPDINIPRFGEWIHPSNQQFWKGHLSSFPPGTKETYGLLSARIFPLPEPVRTAIFKAFAPATMTKSSTQMAALLTESKNKDCLVRMYLGRRAERKPSDSFKLRNFELLVNEAEWLRLDTSAFADTLGRTLAALHWQAGVDANDVEFVLGSSPMIMPAATASDYSERTKDDARFVSQGLDFTKRSVRLWLLDFNRCQKFPRSDAGLKLIIDGFLWNDPYYPRPGSKNEKDQALWRTFKSAYLEESAELLKVVQGEESMADAFIKGVEADRRVSSGSLF
ncbi:hypothetical protein TI39_contig323g00044 [Zymoseptoria brevis]|uniref:DUF3669 domain-containing protein n=1 Tax=Zymoseptoria brevis TaxID=1047168 RepID=A0A0F4GT20_9PEZI|nr:hypothetical protein TI39_contig323g00044 [Zymoseptoria brevis]